MNTASVSQLEQHVGQTMSGQYTLAGVDERTTQFGDRYKTLRLVDYSGQLRVFAWPNAGLLDCVPVKTPTPVRADLYVRRLHGEVIANLQGIHELEPHEIKNAAALLSFEACPPGARPALAKLVEFVRGLESELLRVFLNRTLLDPRIAAGITTCKGSQRHHHCEPGGLLTHSIEVAEIARDMAGCRLNPLERAITQVAAFLHDLGKLRAVGSGSVRPVHYLLASHESQTVRMLDPHLEWLRARSPEIAAGLNYTLEFLAQAPSERGHARFVGADLVSAADRFSAALANRKRLADLLAKTLPSRRAGVETAPPQSIPSLSPHETAQTYSQSGRSSRRHTQHRNPDSCKGALQ